MPPTSTSVIAAALLGVSPGAIATPKPKLAAAQPTADSQPALSIEVVEVEQKVQVRLRSGDGRSKILLDSVAIKVEYPSVKKVSKVDAINIKQTVVSDQVAAASQLKVGAGHKVEGGAAHKIAGVSSYKIEGVAGHKVEGKLLASIGCDGVVTDGSATFKLEGTSTFAFPDGTKITLQGGKGSQACGKVDVMNGNQRVRLTGKGSSVKIGKLQHDRWITDHKTEDGLVFLKVEAATSHKVDGKSPSWAVMESKVEGLAPAGIVFDAGDGIAPAQSFEVELTDILVSSLSGTATHK